MKVFSFSLLALLFLGQSCSSDDPDTRAPSLLLSSGTSPYGEAEVCGELAPNVFQLNSSGALNLEIYLVDDEGLSQLKIDIHENHDCHGHNKRTQDWYYQEIIDLEGNEARISKVLQVPEEVSAGNYHLGLLVLDAAGNEGNQEAYDIKVVNNNDTEAPRLTLIAPSVTSLNVRKGEKIPIKVQVSDNRALIDASKWTVKYKDLSNGNFFTLLEESFDIGSNYTTASYDVVVPETWISGQYEILIKAFDGVNNASEEKRFLLELN